MLEVGDEVFAVDVETGEREVTRITAIRSAQRECLALRTSDERRLVVTPDHPVYSPERGSYEHAGRWITDGLTRLASLTDVGLESVEVDTAEAYVGVRRVFDLTVESEHHNFIAEGFVVHNKSPADGGDGFEEDTGGDEVTVQCEQRCFVTTECLNLYGSLAECHQECMSWYDELAPFGEDCIAAQDADSLCVSTLSCEEAGLYLNPTTPNYPCVGAYDDYVRECYFGGGYTSECRSYCDVALVCSDPPLVDDPDCMRECGSPIRDAEQAADFDCVDALEAQFTCVGALSCDEFREWDEGVDPYPCVTETEAANAACAG